MTFRISIHQSVHELDSQQWNRLVTDNHPFSRYEFFQALEDNQCVGSHYGWYPHHISISEQNQLLAVMPLYLKTNSYGEFVFDQAWEQAYQQNGLDYFPKLVAATPYTPIQGQRILLARGKEWQLYPMLLQTLHQLCLTTQSSGFHFLFADQATLDYLQTQEDIFLRHDCQFHWYNRMPTGEKYRDFEAFLAQMAARKRKNIKKERRFIQDSGIHIRVLDGYQASAEDWLAFDRFYHKTFAEKWGVATLNYGFFTQLAAAIPDQIVLVLADLEDKCIAGALMYRSHSRLFGRFWGCIEEIDYLHFECCYYQGIEYCIRHQLQKFEPGAQGEHKVPRGFEPVLTTSAHYLRDRRFYPATRAYIAEEKKQLHYYMQQMRKRLPYKCPDKTSDR